MKYIIKYDFDALNAIHDIKSHFCNASQETLQDYYKTGERLIKRKKKNQTIVDVIIKAKTSNTFYKWLNGTRFYLCNKIEWNMELYELTSDTLYCEDAYSLFDDLQHIANFDASDFDLEFNEKKSKRTALKGLPSNWREQVVNYNPVSKYRLPLITMALTGCRPSELVKGIEVSITKDDISFFIMGTKVSHEKGQLFRTISYPQNSSNPLIKMLKNTIGDSADKFMVSIEKAVNLTVETRRISKRLWPEHKESITCYCFRHQLSADMKKSKKGDDVSRVLGHSTDKTRKRYGHVSQGRGLVAEITVTVPRPIRKVARTPNFSPSPN